MKKPLQLFFILSTFMFNAISGANFVSGFPEHNSIRNFHVTNPPAVPVSSFSVSTNPVCAGAPVVLTDNSTNSPTGWNWQMPGATTASASVSSPTVIYNIPGTYTISLTASNASGTGNTYTAALVVNALPTVSILGPAVPMCSGGGATLVASGAASYTWASISSSAVITTNTYAINPQVSNTYSVVGTSLGGCSSAAAINVTVLPSPTISAGASRTIICKGECSTLTANGANTYTWSTGDNSVQIVVSPTLLSSFVYSVTGTDSNGCVSNTATVLIKVASCFSGNSGARGGSANTGCFGGPGAVGEWQNLASVSIAPNPGNGFYTVSGLPQGESISLQVFDSRGREVWQHKGNAGELSTIQLHDLANGVYLFKIQSVSALRLFRIIKE